MHKPMILAFMAILALTFPEAAQKVMSLLTVLGGLAEFEEKLIKARTGKERERAKARGIRMGRKPKLIPHQQREAIARRKRGEALTETARSYNVSRSTISRLPLTEATYG